MDIEIRENANGWTYYVHNLSHGRFYTKSKSFFKREKTEGRYRKLPDGPGHGFPVKVLNRLASDGCQTIVIREGNIRYVISFKDFAEHKEHRNLKNERKVFCSLKWFRKEKIEQKVG